MTKFPSMSYERHRAQYPNRYPAISDLARRARRRTPPVAWAYLESGTGTEALLRRNREALEAITFQPRFCRGAQEPNLQTTLFGTTYSAPFGVAPVGLTGLIWPRAEVYLAKMARELGVPYTLSTVATETPETIGPLAGDMGWFQLYPPKERELCAAILERARQAGFHTLLITADVPMASRRERTRRAGLQMPPKINARMLWQGITHPAWSLATLRRGLPRLRTIESYTDYKDMKFVSGYVGNRLGGTLDWEYCRWVKSIWDGPVLLKGVLHPDDARQAVASGLDGVVVSNHGGRQFNGAPAAISVLPAVAEAVGGQAAVLFDSGIRDGLDIIRALSRGADFVLLGRAYLYGIAALGQYGGHYVTDLLADDLRNNLVQLGVENLNEL